MMFQIMRRHADQFVFRVIQGQMCNIPAAVAANRPPIFQRAYKIMLNERVVWPGQLIPFGGINWADTVMNI